MNERDLVFLKPEAASVLEKDHFAFDYINTIGIVIRKFESLSRVKYRVLFRLNGKTRRDVVVTEKYLEKCKKEIWSY